MCKSGIYKITNITDNKVYIGQSVNVDKRIKRHKSDLKNKKHPNIFLQRAYDKYAKFKYDIIEYCEVHMLDEKEVYWIAHYKSTNREFGYNFESGGNINKIIHEETKDKIREANKGSSNLLTEDDVREIKIAIHLGIAQIELSDIFNVSPSTINKIAKGKNWYWILSEFNNSHENSYIEAKARKENRILELFKEGLSVDEIISTTPYTLAEIRNILRGKATDKKEDRYAKIKSDYKNGLSKKDILEKYNISTSVFENAIPNIHTLERKNISKVIFDMSNSGYSNNDISKKLGIHRTTVTEYLKGRVQIKRKIKLLTENLKKEILKLNDDGLSQRQIAVILKIGRPNIRKVLEEGGIKVNVNIRQVVQFDKDFNMVSIWDSLSDAAQSLGKSAQSISKVCKGKQRTAYGYKWMYKEDYDKYIEEQNSKLA